MRPRVHLRMPDSDRYACGGKVGRATWVVAACTCQRCKGALTRQPGLAERVQASRQITIEEAVRRGIEEHMAQGRRVAC